MISTISLIEPMGVTEFAWIKHFLHARTGIVLRQGKESMVMGRLAQRLRHHGLTTYGEYFQRIQDPNHQDEQNLVVDLLTTNETYFFREPQHFRFLRDAVRAYGNGPRPFRVWSAASSSGEEAYSAAMVLADCLPSGTWEVIGTDISSRVLERARRGLYPITAAEKIPQPLLQKYCLKGSAEYEGYLLVEPRLRKKVSFVKANLTTPLPDIGKFDIIFLRNIMIYFGNDTKQLLIERMERMLCPHGHLLIGHSETLHGITANLTMRLPSVYSLTAG